MFSLFAAAAIATTAAAAAPLHVALHGLHGLHLLQNISGTFWIPVSLFHHVSPMQTGRDQCLATRLPLRNSNLADSHLRAAGIAAQLAPFSFTLCSFMLCYL